MPRFLKYTIPEATGTEICQSQTLIANGPLTINGSLSNPITNIASFGKNGYARNVVVMAGNFIGGGAVLTVIGTQNDVSIQEDIPITVGPQAGVLLFDTITSITLIGYTNAQQITVGAGTAAAFLAIGLDPYLTPMRYNLAVDTLSTDAPPAAAPTVTLFASNNNNILDGETYISDSLANKLVEIYAPNPATNSFIFPVTNSQGAFQYAPYMPVYSFFIVAVLGIDPSQTITLTFNQA